MPGWIEASLLDNASTGVGLVVTAVVAVLVARPLARRVGVPALGAAAWLVALGVVVTLTMTPGTSWGPVTERTCSLTTWSLLEPSSLLGVDQRGANVLLLVPLGLLSALPRTRRTLAVALGAALALPFVAETFQYLVPALARVCDVEDLADNLTGVASGALLGLLVRAWWVRRTPGDAAADAPEAVGTRSSA